MRQFRNTSLLKPALATFLLAVSVSVGATDLESPFGHWMTENGNFEVEIQQCGKAICGFITRILPNKAQLLNDEKGKVRLAKNIRGIKVLRNFILTSSVKKGAQINEWSGEIYDIENDRTYECLMIVDRAKNRQGDLVLRSYTGIPIFGKTQRWSRLMNDQSLSAQH